MKRRVFIERSASAIAASVAIPTIVPASVFGKNAPGNRITVGMIGTGRQAIHANLNNGFLKLDNCQVVAVNDVDSWRRDMAAKTINEAYSNKKGRKSIGVKSYDDYRELIADKSIDAVMVSTTDHWHAPAGITAAMAGKHVCIEKALSVSYGHSLALIKAVQENKVSNRLDSEFRSLPFFQKAIEIVHNEAIGPLTGVTVGVPAELNGSAVGPQPAMQVPEELNYDMWLGPAFPAPYTLKRVHDRHTIDTRPGWLRIEDYCNGMITNWGAHLCDIALWGMKREYELPYSVEGAGDFTQGLWNTIESFDIQYTYADGFSMRYTIDQPYVRFEGERGWVKIGYPDQLEVSDPSLLNYKPGPNEISWAKVLTDKADFLRAVETGERSLEPLEVGHNVYFTTLMGLISIKLGRKLEWDKEKQLFKNDIAANSMLVRPVRKKWLDDAVYSWINDIQDQICGL